MTLTATLQDDEAVLRFPYDEGLRQLLRAIPGRRWDSLDRTWRLPLGPEQAEALARMLAALDDRAQVQDALDRRIARRRARRDRRCCQIELARPDRDWWLGFATDGPSTAVRALLDHDGAREIESIGRALIPLDAEAVALIEGLRSREELRLSVAAENAIAELKARGQAREAREHAAAEQARYQIEFRRDRRGEHWILIAARGAALARVLAARAGLRPVEGPQGSVGLVAVEHDAPRLLELVGQLEDLRCEPRVSSWLRRVTSWRGNVDVDGPPQAPLLLLLGDPRRLPSVLREQASEIPGGASVALTEANWRHAVALDGWVSGAARRCGAALERGLPAPPAVLELSTAHEDASFVLAPGHQRELLERFAAIPGAIASARTRGSGGEQASFPALRADPFCVPELDAFLAASGAWVADDALALLQQVREEHARSAGLVALSAAHDSELRVDGLGGELKPFQRAGVAYLLARRRAFLADEQGLGKTIQALATIEAANAYPAIVVCPANLKLNWLREARAWLPERSVAEISGYAGAGEGGEAQPADVTILNYDIAHARLAQLTASAPRALIVDEAHYCKNAGARRTQAVAQLAAAVPQEGIVLALTGTPVVNRPAELVSQLRILGRLREFGSGAKFGARFRGADAHHRLHWHLRARCFVRRLKADVLPQLPAKTRSIVPIELDNEGEYRLAESDLMAWLRSQPLDLRELDAKLAAALRAERLVRLNALKLLAARGKLAAALAWIHDFRSSGERLVVFARHREVQQALISRFPDALHILGEDSPQARDRALREFQDGEGDDNQLIVCSMEVAGQGITLTRSSNVAFLELDWTPAKHDQAEDRCHRIGQQDAVNAYYLLAAETIDETIATLLERKRAVIGAVTDGREEDEEGVLDALVRELRGAPYRRLRAVA